MRSEGGKTPRPPGPGHILQTGKSVLQIPGTPEADSLAVTVHVSRHAEIRRCLWSSYTYNQPTPKGQGLGSGMGTGKGFQALAFIVRQPERRCKRHGHCRSPDKA